MTVLVTGGAGFIGSNFLNLMVPACRETLFVNFDKLTYAANLNNLNGLENKPNYVFYRGDVADYAAVDAVFARHNPDTVIHFAAESHVDRSIVGPADFIRSNIVGTFNILEACRRYWQDEDPESRLFYQVSTDEVYGSLGNTGFFTEETPYDPSSPYSASKASSDHLVRAYHRTYGLPVVITNCSNNYGPYQFPEKLIPVMIINALAGQNLPVYGKGENVRDWLYVNDHCEAIRIVMERGKRGETYNIGGGNEWKNIDLVREICRIMAAETGKEPEHYLKLISFVQDRPGHDLRYAIDSSKIQRELGWKPAETFATGLRKTVRWYLHNQEWVRSIKNGDYRKKRPA